MLADESSSYFTKPPTSVHEYYSEIMEDYVDLVMIKRRLQDGRYMSMFSFKQDVRSIWAKAFTYYKHAPKVL